MRPASQPSVIARIAGIAGLGYVAGAAIENMAVLKLPAFASPIAHIRSLYADHAFAVVTGVAGALSLLAFGVFAASLYGLLRTRERRAEPWATVGLVGGVGAPVVASIGLVANAILVSKRGVGLSDDVTRSLFDVYAFAHIVSGIFAALFLLGNGIAVLRTRALPPVLGWAACAVGAPIALAPVAAFTGDHALQVVVAVLFSTEALWVFFTSLWLVLAGDIAAVEFARRAAFLVLVIAAGLVGAAMLAVPSASPHFFSWGLGPAPLAAFAGGVYVGSAGVYAAALKAPWSRARALVAGAVVLAVSVFIITLVHLDKFDFHRIQAWAWVVLFAGFSVLMAGILACGRSEPLATEDAALARGTRALLAIVALLLGALAVALWAHPGGFARTAPFALPALGGRFAGSWIALLSTLTAWAAVRNRVGEARLPALALIALPAGALLAALRTASELHPAGAGVAYIAALVMLILGGAAVVRTTRRSGAAALSPAVARPSAEPTAPST